MVYRDAAGTAGFQETMKKTSSFSLFVEREGIEEIDRHYSVFVVRLVVLSDDGCQL